MKSNALLFIVVVLSAIVVLPACKKHGEDCNTTLDKAAVLGTWKHDYPKLEPDFTHPDEYNRIKFTSDSFFLAVTHRGDMLHANGCNEVLWTEYARGVYRLSPGKVFFEGIYTEADYTEKTGGCYNTGAYIDSFTIRKCDQYLVMYDLDPHQSNSVDRNINMLKE